jgi:hypothetical protein
MTDRPPPAWELKQEARAINATDWQPPPGMVKKRCSQCHYWFAVLAAEAEGDIALSGLCGAGHPVSTRIRESDVPSDPDYLPGGGDQSPRSSTGGHGRPRQ